MKKLCLLTITLGTLVLSGCGFKLRGEYGIPPEFAQIQLHTVNPHAPLRRTLAKRFSSYNIKLSQSPDVPQMTLLPEKLDRRLLSLFPSGQVAEYELVYSVNYHLQLPGQDMQSYSFEVIREYQDDPETVLAKSRELDLILSEMRQQAADRIIRQLAGY